MKKITEYKPSKSEINYIKAFSRESTVKAYTNWTDLSDAERLCLDLFLNENDRVLDLGCGTGRIPKTIGSKFGGYLGVDYSAEMIKAAEILNPNFKFRCEDILNPTFKERNFDAVLLMNNVLDMLHPIERRKDVFTLTKDYLASSGVLIFSSHMVNNGEVANYYEEDYHGAKVNTYRSTFGQLCEEVEGYGFEIKIAIRDYRSQIADWVYIVATIK